MINMNINLRIIAIGAAIVTVIALLAVTGYRFPGSSNYTSQTDVPAMLLHYADTIIYNGKILTADEQFTIAEAVAIRDEKILSVGDDSQIRELAGPDTVMIDLEGKSVTPGFIDTHHHVHNYAFNELIGGTPVYDILRLADLEGDVSKEGLLRVLRQKAETWPRSEGWVVFTDRPQGSFN